MSTYAANTDVSADKSRAEIERTLRRYGADGFMYGWETNRAVIGFTMNARQVRFVIGMPDPNERRFTHTEARGAARNPDAAYKAWDQACRQRWRALALVVKAKLEAVEAGISEFDTEFLGHLVLPNGATVGEWMAPQIDAAYASGSMPRMLALGAGD